MSKITGGKNSGREKFRIPDGEAVADDSHDVEKCGAVQLHGRLHCAVRDHVVTSGAHMATYMVHRRISTIIGCGKQNKGF